MAGSETSCAETVGMNPTRLLPIKPYDYEDQSVYLPENLNKDGPWKVLRRKSFEHGLVYKLPAPWDHVMTLHDNLEESIRRFPDRPFLGTRKVNPDRSLGEYEFITYREAGKRRAELGAGLLHLGVSVGARVGLYAINSAEWTLVDTAASAYGQVSVPLYDTLGPDAVEYIVNHAECEAIAVDYGLVPKAMEVLPRTPSIKVVVVLGLPSPRAPLPSPPTGSPPGVVILSLDDVRAIGARFPTPFVATDPHSAAIINYTSGTTGPPKGVIMTHRNLLSGTAAFVAAQILHSGRHPSEEESVHLSYLPLAHIYERGIFTSMTHAGAAIGFYSGDITRLLEDMQQLRPTTFPSVPRLWNRIYDKMRSEIDSRGPITRKLFELGYNSKLAALKAGDATGGRWGGFWDKLIFSKLEAKLGGRLQIMVSGSAPISPQVFDFVRVITSGDLLEGYGLTETAAIGAVTLPGDPISGHVGPPSACCEIKLDDVPEMNYLWSDKPYPRGEICIRGHNVFPGYYKNEEATREAIDEDGWFHTGDIGTFIQGGRLKIIDRKKNIFKLSQGEYVSPEKVEAVYCRTPYLLQAFVHGDSLQNRLIAIVVLDPEFILPWAAKRGMKDPTIESVSADPEVADIVLAAILEEGKSAGLNGFEQVVAISIVPTPFTPDNGILTPTLKLKRNVAREVFVEQIADLYHKVNAAEKATRS